MKSENFPKISIVTPSFNQAAYIEETIMSVLNQNYPNIEYIIIDGGSNDGSVEIIQKYSKHLAYWTSEPDDGQTSALEKGFERATGSILGWLCSDDLLEPWTFKEVSNFFINNPHNRIVYGDTTWIDSSGEILRKRKELPFNRFIFLYEHNFIPQPSTFWRRDLYEEVGGLDGQFDVAMDADFWIRCSAVTDIAHVRRQWSKMRLYPQQKTQRLKERAFLEENILRERYYGPETVWSYRMKKATAKSMRLTWKLTTGCYL
ncbi:MAG: glycosyltransferase family 2 protein [Elainellaceae cyanobacterium]